MQILLATIAGNYLEIMNAPQTAILPQLRDRSDKRYDKVYHDKRRNSTTINDDSARANNAVSSSFSPHCGSAGGGSSSGSPLCGSAGGGSPYALMDPAAGGPNGRSGSVFTLSAGWGSPRTLMSPIADPIGHAHTLSCGGGSGDVFTDSSGRSGSSSFTLTQEYFGLSGLAQLPVGGNPTFGPGFVPLPHDGSFDPVTAFLSDESFVKEMEVSVQP